MTHHLVYGLYYCSLLFAAFYGIYRFKRLDRPAKVLAVLACCALINESAAYYLAKKYHNNLPLYAIYGFVEFGLISLYFNALIDVFIKKNIGIYIGVAGIILGVLNLIFIQGLNSLNSYFLFFEGLSVIGMSLFAFFRLLLKDDELRLYKYPHFWLVSILIFFWCTTFLYWGLYDYFSTQSPYIMSMVVLIGLIAGIVTYSGFGCVFLLFPKMQPGNE